MKMKRYFAPDMRQAIRKVREDQGPDAVILSNRRINGGVEIIAAVDYDQALVNRALGLGESETPATGNVRPSRPAPASGGNRKSRATPKEQWHAASLYARGEDGSASPMEKIEDEIKALRNILESPLLQFGWGEMRRVQPLKANLLKRLMALGLAPELCRQIADQVMAGGGTGDVWAESLRQLADEVPVADDDILSEGGVVALVGPTGVGKTTTVAKLAARFALRHGRRHVALVTTDSYRIGAHEQLRTYGRILGIPVQTAGDRDELQAVLNHARDRKLVLIDTAGVSQRDLNLMERLATLNLGDQRIRNYLVLSATGQRVLQREVISAFRKAGLHNCIITKIDEAGSLGGVLSVLVEHQLPAAYVGDGQKVPDDLHPARAEKLVRHAVELMQQMDHSPEEEMLAFNFGGLVANAHA
jgi:flagellar biosynthesis protein FlhF